MHSRKSLLFNEGKPWCKRNSANIFDVAMGSYDGAEICELVGLFILDKLRAEFKNDNIGLYMQRRWTGGFQERGSQNLEQHRKTICKVPKGPWFKHYHTDKPENSKSP